MAPAFRRTSDHHRRLRECRSFMLNRTSQIIINLLTKSFSSSLVFLLQKMAARLVNYNKRLFGPGPVARLPAPGITGLYARMPPLQGFCMAAAHGTALGFVVSFYYKFAMGDPDTAAIKKYYEENPPR